MVWMVGRGWAGGGRGGGRLHKAGGRGADKTGGAGGGVRVLSVLVHVRAVGPGNLAGGRRALTLKVHLFLVSLLGGILRGKGKREGMSLPLGEPPKSCRWAWSWAVNPGPLPPAKPPWAKAQSWGPPAPDRRAFPGPWEESPRPAMTHTLHRMLREASHPGKACMATQREAGLCGKICFPLWWEPRSVGMGKRAGGRVGHAAQIF